MHECNTVLTDEFQIETFLVIQAQSASLHLLPLTRATAWSVYLSCKTRAHNARMFRKIDARTRTHIQHTYNTYVMSCIIVLCMYVFVYFISPLFRCLSEG